MNVKVGFYLFSCKPLTEADKWSSLILKEIQIKKLSEENKIVLIACGHR